MKIKKLLLLMVLSVSFLVGCSTKVSVEIEPKFVKDTTLCAADDGSLEFRFQFDEEGSVSGAYVLSREDLRDITEESILERNDFIQKFIEEQEATDLARIQSVIIENKEEDTKHIETVTEVLINENTPEAIREYFEVDELYGNIKQDNLEEFFEGTGIVCKLD